jgi:hypothetical protein
VNSVLVCAEGPASEGVLEFKTAVGLTLSMILNDGSYLDGTVIFLPSLGSYSRRERRRVREVL